MNEKIKRLPHWAKNHISDLVRRVEELKEEIKQYIDNTETRIYYTDMIKLNDLKRYVSNKSIVSFIVDDVSNGLSRKVVTRIILKNNRENTHKVLDIYSDETISIKPVASNHVEIDIAQ